MSSHSVHVEPVDIDGAGDWTCQDAGLQQEINGAAGWLACEIDPAFLTEGEHSPSSAGDFLTNSQECATALDIYPTEAGQQLDWEANANELIEAVLVRGSGDDRANLYHYSDGEGFDEGLQAPSYDPIPSDGPIKPDIEHLSICVPFQGQLGVGKSTTSDYTAVVDWAMDKERQHRSGHSGR